MSLHAKKVVLGVRDIQKGEAARATNIKALPSQGDTTQVEVWSLDSLSYPRIKTFASRATESLDQIDIVVLNAGIMIKEYTTPIYGWEETHSVDHSSGSDPNL